MYGLMPTILNSANEYAVDLYLKDKINFGQIYSIISECMDKFDYSRECTLENILDAEDGFLRVHY